ncbi:hypothetical protein CHCC15291_0675 [Bacillus licheniformis]|nr:hypothetical protein CHCC15291_0675 [Bacillus licheniformis]TWL99247.1 hypothetical protein CHCC15289_4685 [Bacillus licheniformis]
MKNSYIITLSTAILLTMIGIWSFSGVTFAKSVWYKPVIHSDDDRIKVSVDKTNITKGSVTVTINSSNYNNGNNVVYYHEKDKKLFGPNAKIKITENGYYEFPVSNVNGNYEYSPETVTADHWVTVEINNIDNKKPTVEYKGTYMTKNGYRFMDITFDDEMAIRRIKLPDGKYTYGDLDYQGTGIAPLIDVTRNGNYTFEAEDYAGNKITYTVKITDYKKASISVTSYKYKSKYVSGKTLPYAKVSVNDEFHIYGTGTANSKGIYKVRLKTLPKNGSTIYVWTNDKNKKYVTNYVKVKVKK